MAKAHANRPPTYGDEIKEVEPSVGNSSLKLGKLTTKGDVKKPVVSQHPAPSVESPSSKAPKAPSSSAASTAGSGRETGTAK